MTAQHTPGPWVEDYSCDNVATIYGGTEAVTIVADVYGDDNNPTPDANARLIAAAPLMLEALQTLVDWYRIPDGVSASEYEDAARAYNAAQAAIRAATGEDA